MLCPFPLPSRCFSNPHTANLLKKVKLEGKANQRKWQVCM